MMTYYNLIILLSCMVATFGVGVWFGYSFGAEATERRIANSIDPPRFKWIKDYRPIVGDRAGLIPRIAKSPVNSDVLGSMKGN
jgi:hypothetical protein